MEGYRIETEIDIVFVRFFRFSLGVDKFRVVQNGKQF